MIVLLLHLKYIYVININFTLKLFDKLSWSPHQWYDGRYHSRVKGVKLYLRCVKYFFRVTHIGRYFMVDPFDCHKLKFQKSNKLFLIFILRRLLILFILFYCATKSVDMTIYAKMYVYSTTHMRLAAICLFHILIRVFWYYPHYCCKYWRSNGEDCTNWKT